jgi:Glycosyl hydrolases family 38 N-terminal domain
VETAFLWKWWASQTNDTLKDTVRKLVSDGQLEITGGGWCMNDEAVTHYQSTIDQFTWGFRCSRKISLLLAKIQMKKN